MDRLDEVYGKFFDMRNWLLELSQEAEESGKYTFGETGCFQYSFDLLALTDINRLKNTEVNLSDR